MWNELGKALIEDRFLIYIISKLNYGIGKIFRTIWSKRQKIVNNRIVLTAVDGRYDCNPKYITEEIIKRNLPYELIWLVKSDKHIINGNFPDEIQVLKKGSLEAYKAMATAKIWIENELKFLKPYALLKKKGQIYIQTWHGSLGFKRIGRANQHNQTGSNKKLIKKVARRCNNVTDFCISNSEFETNVFREAYWTDTPILLYGHARNDILLNQDLGAQKKMKEYVLERLGVINALPTYINKFSVEERTALLEARDEAINTRYILYAPTYRIDGGINCFNVDYEMLMQSLTFRFGGTWKVIIRFHLHNRKDSNSIKNNPDLINATSYPDMQELLCIADAGLSDYSSWLCDFALTKKPAFIYATDFDIYGHDRGFYYPLETTPFPIAKNNKELSENIMGFDIEKYEIKRQEFLKDKGCIEDGHASERIVNKIEEIIGHNTR